MSSGTSISRMTRGMTLSSVILRRAISAKIVTPGDGKESGCRLERLQNQNWDTAMDIDKNKIDQAVLALLHLGLHEDFRAWKGFDWDALDRLHEKGFIGNPKGKGKSVVFSE